MQRRIFLTCILLVSIAACTSATAMPLSPTPTLVSTNTAQHTKLSTEPIPITPSVEVASPTAQATPTSETTPTIETTFTLEPTITATTPPLPTLNIPPTQIATSLPKPSVGSSAIQFYEPGPLSELVSPVVAYGYAIPGFNNVGRLSLVGEDGSLLDSEVLQLNTAFTWAYFYWELDFEIQGAGELARLSMSTQDEYGRLVSVYSVHLILLSEGYSVVNAPGNIEERCVIQQPEAGRRIAGGTLAVTGEMRPVNNQPLVVQLVDRSGNLLASQAAAMTPASDDSFVPFQVILPYSISIGTWARLSVSQADDRIGGTMYLYSREVYLNP